MLAVAHVETSSRRPIPTVKSYRLRTGDRSPFPVERTPSGPSGRVKIHVGNAYADSGRLRLVVLMLYRRRRDGLKGLGGLRQCRLKSLPPLVADGGLCERVLLKFVQGSNRSLEGMIRLKGTVCLRVERNHTKGSVVKIPKRGIAEGMRPTGTGARRAISGGHAGKSVAYPDTASQSIVSFCCQRSFSPRSFLL